MRKEADFNVDDRIELFIEASNDVMTAVSVYRKYLETETLATILEKQIKDSEASKEIKVGNEVIIINIIRVK